MTQSVEWANAKESAPLIEDDPSGWSDAYGSMVSRGHAGIWLSETMLIEGTPDELRTYAERLIELVDQLDVDPEKFVRPAKKSA